MSDETEPAGFEAVRAAKAAGGKSDSECVQVVVRCRPMNKTEKENKCSHIVDVDTGLNQITIKNPQGGPKSFTFDGAFDENTQQRPFYDDACFTLVESILVGFNATIFAYGQTGCGKSFSMQGPPSPIEMRGVIPNAFAHLFEYVKSTDGIEFLVRCSYLEIYNEEVRDLLDTKTNKKCDIRENPKKGVFVNNLSEIVVDTAAKIQAVLDKGLEGRTVAATNMNAESSRSHSIFTIVVEMSSIEEETGREILRAGKLNLVDLAGSERQKKTGASGDTLKQGAMINLSLTSLGNVIQALTEAREHIPYRDSKLTRLLQDSLGGNTKTLMIAAVSPADYNFDETMSTLRYANRAKNIKNKPKINEDPKDTLLRTYKEEIERLKKQLEEFKNGTSEGGQMDMGAINNMMAMLNGDAMNSNMITHNDAEEGPDEAAKLTGGGGGGGGGMNFAAFAGGGGGGSNKTSPRELAPIGEGSPQGKTSPRLNKDRTPERLVKGKSGGPTSSEKVRQDEHYQMLAVEHEYVHGQLKERDEEIEQEKQRVASMASKLQELESQLMSNMHAHSFFGEAGGGGSQRVVQESADEVAEREAAKRAYEARKSTLKSKRDAKKVKARNEKQEHEREKEFLLDSLREQSRNLAEETQERMLYEQIVHAVFSSKDLKRVLDKCRWNDEQHYWVLPAIKQKGASESFALPDINKSSNGTDDYSPRGNPHSSNSRGGSQGNGYGVSASIDNSGMFSSGKPSANGSRAGTGNRNNFTISPRIGDHLPVNASHAPYTSAPPLESQTPRSRINSGRKVKGKSGSENNVLPASLTNGGGGGYGGGVGVANGGNGDGDDYNYPVDLAPNSKPPKAKNKGKKRKQKKTQAEGGNGGANGGDDKEYSDWGFNGNGVPQNANDEPAYSDDEDFDEDENGFQNHDTVGDNGPDPGDTPLSFSQFAQCQPMGEVGSGGGKKKKKVKESSSGGGDSPGVSPRAPQLFPSLK